jgi:hypothetical protein
MTTSTIKCSHCHIEKELKEFNKNAVKIPDIVPIVIIPS